MNWRSVAWGGLWALACPVAGRAQQMDGPPLPRWFVGAGAGGGSYQEPGRAKTYEGYGPALAAGRYLGPRWAVQAGLVFSQRSDQVGFNGTYDAARFNPGGALLFRTESNIRRLRAFAVPVVLRYSLARDPARGWQADALAGATWGQTHRRETRAVTDVTAAGEAFRRSESDEIRAGIGLTAGAGLRHALGRHLEFTAEALGHLSLTPRRPLSQRYLLPGLFGRPVPPVRERLTATVLVGVRYRFGPSGSALPVPAAAGAPVPARWFAGLGAGLGRYQLRRDESAVRVWSPVPTVGVQLTPRWALQASAAYGQDRSQTTYAYSRTFASGRRSAAYDLRDTRLRTWAVPVLARYAPGPAPARPWQVELLAGATGVRSAYYRTVSTTDDTGTVQPELAAAERRLRTALFPTVGAGVRYARGPRWAATADVAFTRLLAGGANLFADRVWATNGAVGVRYVLGRLP